MSTLQTIPPAAAQAAAPIMAEPEIPDFVPIALEQMFVPAMAGLPVYLERDADGVKRHTLHCGESARFSDFHRRRLQERSIRCVFVQRQQHGIYRERVERELETIVANGTLGLVARAGLVYEMALELLHEWMNGETANRVERLESVARAACTFIASQRIAFAHFFSCARHDDNVATHMANVGLWMACLAHAGGTSDRDGLIEACMAGFLHDTGMRTLPRKMMAKAEALTSEELGQLRSHPAAGADILKSQGVTMEALVRVAFEHHERLDGSGYPAKLTREQIHPLAQLCAVVDSFEAMTSARAHKPRTQTIAEANAALQAEGAKYDQRIVETWIGLLKQASEQGAFHEAVDKGGGAGRRVHQRYAAECAMQLWTLSENGGRWVDGSPMTGKLRNISRSGVGIEMREALSPGTYVRFILKGKGSLQDRILEGQVMRCRQVKGVHEIGIRFCAPGK
jgi:HD-GYP domain-containing protein (c-di-GMP phosphodiesterase class II)